MSEALGLTVAEPRLSDAPVGFNSNSGEWFGVQVAPRHEKRVTTLLARRNTMEVFLPTITERHRWSDRTQKVEVPLFCGYTFVRLPSPESRIAVLRCAGVIRLVGKEWVGTPIPEKEIEDIKILLNSRVGVWIHPFLQAGDRVRIRGGALEGVEGVLLENKGSRHLVVSVNLIQKSMAISIDGYELEKL